MSYCLLFITVAGCGKDACDNHNPVFEKYGPTDNKYKKALVRYINGIDPEQLSYYIEGYEKSWDKQFMRVRVAGSDLCAVMILDITDSRRLENFIKVGGISYSGAELSGLIYRIDSTDGAYQFHFIDVNKITD